VNNNDNNLTIYRSS